MLKVISAVIALAQLIANARAGGSDKPAAVRVGTVLFAEQWPAQVLTVYADAVEGHDVIGLRVSGRHFHGVLTRRGFADEVAALAARSFSAGPMVEEVDIWFTTPLEGKDLVVSGDVNTPTWRTVFTISVLRGETPASIHSRIRSGPGVYVDQDWERSALK